MKCIALLLTVAALASCGANDAPFTPSGTVGMSVGTNGVNTGASLGASNGTVSVGIGI